MAWFSQFEDQIFRKFLAVCPLACHKVVARGARERMAIVATGALKACDERRRPLTG
jgi:hypothetical protein